MVGSELISLLNSGVLAAFEAGIEIDKIYRSNIDIQLSFKEDKSPVTLADFKANQIITYNLERTGLPIISEESAISEFSIRKQMDYFWLVDPLDGTREFINQTDEFTVNIALIKKKSPILGVIYIPAKQQMYLGIKGTGSFMVSMDQISTISLNRLFEIAKPLPYADLTAAITIPVSRSNPDKLVTQLIERIESKSNYTVDPVIIGSAIKFCRVAEGFASIYPRFEHLKEWDIAAGQAIIEASGGIMYNLLTHQPVTYNTEHLEAPGFIAVSSEFRLKFESGLDQLLFT